MWGQVLPEAEGAILKFISAPRSGLPPCGGRWHSKAVTDEGYCNKLLYQVCIRHFSIGFWLLAIGSWPRKQAVGSLNGVALRGLPPRYALEEGLAGGRRCYIKVYFRTTQWPSSMWGKVAEHSEVG